MKFRAAVAFAAGDALEIVEVEGPEPASAVKITATGVCHTDAFTLSVDDPEGTLSRHPEARRRRHRS